jgi:hypothetical protein
VETDIPIPNAVERLNALLADRPRIGPKTSRSSDRRLFGLVDGINVRLWVGDANAIDWHIEFKGAFELSVGGAVLRGAVEIPERTQLRAIMWMFRIVFALVPILVLWLDLRDLSVGRPVVPMPLIWAMVLAVGVALGTRRMEADGGRQAEEDAEVLTSTVARLLRG